MAKFKICPAPLLFLRLIEAEVRLRRIKCSDIACVVVVAAVVVAVVVVAIVVVAVAVVVAAVAAAVVVVVLLLLLAASMNEKKAAFVHSKTCRYQDSKFWAQVDLDQEHSRTS